MSFVQKVGDDVCGVQPTSQDSEVVASSNWMKLGAREYYVRDVEAR